MDVDKWINKLLHLDRRIIYVIILLSVALPLWHPLGLPINTTESVQKAYDALEKVPDGGLILMSWDYGPATRVELHPMALAAADQALKKNKKLAIMALYPEGQAIIDDGIRELLEMHPDKSYGKDLVNLGYKAGNEAVPVRMGLDFRSQFPTDTKGTPLSDIPMLRKLTRLQQFELVITYSSGFPGAMEHIRITASEYKMPLIVGTTAVQTPQYLPFYNSGQVVGMIGGLRGAAEYEKISKFKGTATAGMDAQSVAHFTIAALIVLANVLTLLQFIRGRQR